MHDVSGEHIPTGPPDGRFTAGLVNDIRHVLETHGYVVPVDTGMIEITCHLTHLLHGCGDHCYGHTLDGD